MRRMLQSAVAAFTCLSLCAAQAPAAAPPEPLNLFPAQTDVVLSVPHPRQLAETGLKLQTLKQLQKIGPAAEFLHSNSFRNFQRLLAYFEKELGAQWPELLDQIAGGGVTLGVKIAPDPAPVLLVIQGTDPTKEKRFLELALTVLEQASQQDVKDKLQRKNYRDIETVEAGELHIALAGAAILASNNEETFHRALDLHLDGNAKSLAKTGSARDAWKLLPPDCLARIWLNLETVKQRPETKPLFSSPPGDPAQTVLAGGMLDAARRSPFVCAGLFRKGDEFTLSVRMPAGREGMAEFMALHIPPAGKPGSRALLEPRDVIFSSSFYLDLPTFWEKRNELLPADAVKGLEQGEKNLGKLLPGAKLSTLFGQAGTHHRFVAVCQEDFGYQARARQPLPAFALVTELSDPEPFAKSMNTLLRAAAFLAGTQVKLKLIEEKHGEHPIVGYRFSETAKIAGDADGSRFNFSPAFVRVGDQFVVSSSIELAHELVDILEKDAKDDSAAALRARIYAKGGVAYGRNFADLLATQAVLGQALTHDEAQRQVKALFAWAEELGHLDIESGYGAHDWHYDFKIKLK